MDDIEKTRHEYVVRLEEQLRYAQLTLSEIKPIANKWAPVVATENTGADLRVTLGFGGKRTTISVPTANIISGDVTTLTSAIVEAMITNIVQDVMAEQVRPHLEKAKVELTAIAGAGKW
jgi:hypothetical protein